MTEIYNTLKNLCERPAAGTLTAAADYAEKTVSQYAQVKHLAGLSFAAKLKGKSDYTVMVEAHIDEISMVVTNVTPDGFLKVAACGGIDCRILPAAPVTVWGSNPVPAVFCSTPAHLSKGETEYGDITELLIDTGIRNGVEEIIKKGDFITFRTDFQNLSGKRVTSKALDDRAACAVLIELCRRLSSVSLPCNVVFLFSDAEELGCRGARTGAFSLNPDEAVAVDVSFADAPDIPDSKCGKLGGGAMLGLSPVLNRRISNALIDIAKTGSIPYQTEVMGASTGTDSDVISITGQGIPCSLVSIPLRNMHTPCEVVDMGDLESACDILEQYLLSGGAANA